MEKKNDNFKFKVSEISPCETALDITVAAKTTEEETEFVYKKIQPVAKIPGFRPGKAPIDMVRKHYSDKVREEVVDSLMSRSVKQFVDDKKIRMIGYPVVEDIKFEFGRDFNFKVRIDKYPEFELKSYTKMKLEKAQKEVTEADIQKELDGLRERNAVLMPAPEETAEKKHFVVIDYSAKTDGVESKDIAGKGQLMNLSAEQIIPGFADSIVGMKLNETKDIQVVFPADFVNKLYAGKSAAITVTLKELKELKMPAIDDELAKDLGYESLENLKVLIKSSLTAKNEGESKKDLREQISKELLKENKFAVPASLVSHQLEDMLESSKALMKKRNNMSETDWNESLPALREKYKQAAEEKVRLFFILNRIIEHEKIEVSDEELSKQKDIIKAYMRVGEEQAQKYFEERKNDLLAMLKEEKVFDLIVGNAKIKTKN